MPTQEFGIILNNGERYVAALDEHYFSEAIWMGGSRRDMPDRFTQPVIDRLSNKCREHKDTLFALCLGSAGIDVPDLNSINDNERLRFLARSEVEVRMRTDGFEEVQIQGQPVLMVSSPTVRVEEENSHVIRAYVEYKCAIFPFRSRQRLNVWDDFLSCSV